MGYDGFCRELTAEQVAAFRPRDARRSSGSGCPTASITFDDPVRGDITFDTANVPDFALSRANGDPLYTLVNPVDDAMMGITHVLRGEDLLSSTPRRSRSSTRWSSSAWRPPLPGVRAPAVRHGPGQQEAVQA